jgi:DNA-directed RNA polymerases I and III subunit RPAC1
VDFKIKELTDEEIVFELSGVEAPLANALRRIMIAEIPTMAIEKVEMWQNTSIIPDENLAHRMGLVPIMADPHAFEFKPLDKPYDESNSLRFKLHAICTKKDPRKPTPLNINDVEEEEKIFNNSNVYSGQLEWVPIGNQAKLFKNNPPRPLHDDILIAKLRPGQEIEMEFIVEKGIGKTHAKWSPVCTAWYRLMPDIRFKQPIEGSDAKELKKLCPAGVFDIEDLGKGKTRATVANSEACTTCRECIRHDKFADKIDLGKRKDVFEFHIESLGIYKPERIMFEALDKLKEKATHWLAVLKHEESLVQ